LKEHWGGPGIPQGEGIYGAYEEKVGESVGKTYLTGSATSLAGPFALAAIGLVGSHQAYQWLSEAFSYRETVNLYILEKIRNDQGDILFDFVKNHA